MEPRRMAMFPLGTVLFPHGMLPLRIFEARYLALTRDCLASDRELAVVLIERGSEVGGGDYRFDIGTAARIVAMSRLGPGQLGMVVAGERRVRVVEWLPDDPYPQAEVVDLDDGSAGSELDDAVHRALATLRRVLGLATELGADVRSINLDLSDDPMVASYQLCGLAPLGPLDGQRLLEIDDPLQRVDTLNEMLVEQADELDERLGLG